ncbi:MAG TPA: hypothetical protein VJH67_00560 [Candidatus Paceibacterota bacterium]
MLPSELDFLTINGGTIASLIFTLVILFSGIVAVIMLWHWSRYGLKSPMIFFMEAVYLFGVAVLVSTAALELATI